ncbi:Cell division protein FtsX [bioreactor metagenome]|jgi:cell division transport system permease protein|uniref:Cell division protein FtsX n=1 Tax=bioreactor metagenome TaxID=1076179 RepID=A0A644VBJ7_9ZZZZ|nr:permease-like cell division protein FtsX [Bacteroidales bacterium]MEA4967498.1 permease-like cell division protein FtsX [Bacteroidaceae bacterium]MEA5100292.1 permease-like cell division protein FtsX [Bacteroidales bacterium]
MTKRQLSFNPVALWSANFSTVLSIALVLFMLGFMLTFIFHAFTASNNLKENVSFTVYLMDGTMEEDALNLEKELKKNTNVKSTQYISSEQAAKIMEEVMGENHLEVLGAVNPYAASIVVNLKAESLNYTTIKRFITSLEAKDIVDNVDYRQDLVKDINNAVYNISAFVLAFIICLLIIAITLINHTIRLTIYSKRFLIRSMELVGAKPSFIRRPFLLKGLFFGLIGGLIANVLLFGILFWVSRTFSQIITPENYQIYGMIGLAILIFGILLAFISTFISVFRFMHLRNEKLYR